MLGKIEQAGSPEEIYDRPRSEFVARFIGSSNVVKGKGLDDCPRRFRRRRAALHRRESRARRASTAVSIRPHDIMLSAKQPPAGENVVPATVVRQVFLGDSRDYMVEVKDGTQLRVVTAAEENIPQGSAVWLHLPPRAVPALLSWLRRNVRGGEDNKARSRYGGYADEGLEFSRRDLLIGSSALAAGAAFSTQVLSAAPPASAITPELIEAAKKEGKVVWYTSVDLPLAEKIAKAFEAKYPGITVRVERTGAERVFQRIGQEYGSNIHAVDVVNSSDAAHFIVWKDRACSKPYVPEDVAKFYPAEHKDPDGTFASFRVWVCIIAYNTNLVKKEEAPKSFADLLDPKWKGKIVKAHPGYSGTIMTATYQMQRDLGWGYFEKLAQQNIMQVQSSADPPKRLGARRARGDGRRQRVQYLPDKEKGEPVEPVYATEGSPLIVGPTGMFKAAPNPNAARLFCNFSFTPECQQLIIDIGGLRSMHPQTKEKAGRTPFKEIKVMKDDPAAVEKNERRDQGALHARSSTSEINIPRPARGRGKKSRTP